MEAARRGNYGALYGRLALRAGAPSAGRPGVGQETRAAGVLRRGDAKPAAHRRGLFLETHYDTETLLNILMNRILRPIGYDYSAIRVTVREV